MPKSSQDQIRYEVITHEDDATGDLILPIPPQLLEQLGWREGDEIEFAISEEGKYILKLSNK
jgi:hypothetical protein